MISIFSRLGQVAIALAVAALIAVSVLTPVRAERVTPGGDSFTRACYDLQARMDGLLADYARGTANSPAQQEDLLRQIRLLGTEWKGNNCQDVFGDIALELPKGVTMPDGIDGTEVGGTTTKPPTVGGTNTPTASPNLAADDDHRENKGKGKGKGKGKRGKGKGRNR